MYYKIIQYRHTNETLVITTSSQSVQEVVFGIVQFTRCTKYVKYYVLSLSGGRDGDWSEWLLPPDEVQTEQLIFFGLLHHPDNYPHSCHRCILIC